MPIFKRKERIPKTKISAPMPVLSDQAGSSGNLKSSREDLTEERGGLEPKTGPNITKIQSNSLSRPQPKYTQRISDIAEKFGGTKVSGSEIGAYPADQRSASMSRLISPTNSIKSGVTSVYNNSSNNVTLRGSPSRGSTASPARHSMISNSSYLLDDDFKILDREKDYTGVELELPDLEVDDGLRERYVHVTKGPTGGFGFELRISYMPDPLMPDSSRPVHVLDPKNTCVASLMSGDILVEVNGVNVEFEPHDRVVDMIRAAGEEIDFVVRSVPELVELNIRGALTTSPELSSSPCKMRSTAKSKSRMLKGVGTLRRAGRGGTKKKTLMRHEGDAGEERVWLIHKSGFSLACVVPENVQGRRGSELSRQTSLVRSGGRESYRVVLHKSGQILDVEEEDLEKANPRQYDRVEDLTELVHLNEPSVLHVLRQRYGASLIHTFAGRHLIVVNPMRQLASAYSDKVMEMFRGSRREDMPPHIFAAAQQAYHSMLSSQTDQSLVLMGVSGSGKTFNTRYLLKYLGSFADGAGVITYEKLTAIDVLLLSFANAATLLNPHATRVTLLYSLEFDPAGVLLGMTIRTFLLERNRVAERPKGEKTFEIFHKLLAGANQQTQSDLLLNAQVSPDEMNTYVEKEPMGPKQQETAAFVWEMVQNAMTTLGVSEEEAKGIWSLVAAIYHLGFAGVRKGAQRGGEKFLNPAAAQRAAQLLGINHEDLGKDIFSPPHGTGSRLSSLFASSPIPGAIPESGSISSPSQPRANQGVEALVAFVSGLYEHAFNALVQLINRSIQTPNGSNAKYSIHILDTPGFQDPESVNVTSGTTFDNLCHNYAQERLQMLFHDSTFTAEQDRYIQESINWSFTEVAISPLPVIDVIDKNVSSRRGLDINIDKKGLLWILDEESIFPGASDSSFLERVQTYHHDNSSEREEPLVIVKKETNQFVVAHCQRSMRVLYNVSGWLRRAREHPSYRVVAQVLSESKSSSVASIFQGRGVAGSSTTLSASSLLIDTSRSIKGSAVSPVASGTKRSSVCLQTKFQLDFLVDVLRKSRQWYIRCILPQQPYKLPDALMHHLADLEDSLEPPALGHIDIPLVRDQIRRGNIVKAARIFKQGFPEFMSFPRFRRRYECLVPVDDRPVGVIDEKKAVEHLVEYLELDQTSLRIGLSQIFFRTDTLVELEERVEEKAAHIFTLFQAHCRRYLWRNKLKELEIDDAAVSIIQSNIRKANIINQWSWWKLLNKIKPLMVVRKTEEEKKEISAQYEKIKTKYELVEGERNVLADNEAKLEEKVRQLTSQLEVERLTSHNAIEQLEQELCDKRQLQEDLNELQGMYTNLKKEHEETQVELMQMTLVQRIQHAEPGNEEDGSGDSVYLEKYRSVCRELEFLKQQKNSEYDEELEELRVAKRHLERKAEGADGELQDLRRTLAQLRKKMAKQGSEMNDLQLHLESQQARNIELEKKQKKFDAELNSSRDETSQERIAKEQLSRERNTMKGEMDLLQQELNASKSENQQLKRDKDELEQASMASSDSVTEISSLKRTKRELESKIEELEDELDEVTIRSESLEQAKSRLELSLQTHRSQHQKEMEDRDEEMDQLQSTMNKKVKSLENQLEDALEEKHTAVKARRDMDRQVAELQAQVGDSENERALRKQLKKTRALLNDVQTQLEYEQTSNKSTNMVKTLRMQLEDSQMNEEAAHKQHRRLQNDYDELQVQNDELMQKKMELESKVSELHHEKSKLNEQLEEDQDEMEQMKSDQESQLSQLTMLQKEFAELKNTLQEVQYEKEEAEKKISELNSTISSLEHDRARTTTFDNSEFKVRELQQKLEFEQTSNRRLETQIHRLKAQMEKMEDAENEVASSRAESDMVRKLHRQIRELRDDIADTERKESDQNKKRKMAETELEELRAEHTSLQSELKLAQKRIESFQQALEGGDDDDDSIGGDDRGQIIDDDSDGSYVPGNYSTHSSDELSDEPPIRKRSTHSPHTKPLTESKQPVYGYRGKISDDESPYSQKSRSSKSKSRSPPKYNNGDKNSEKPWRSRRSKTAESQFSSDEDDYIPSRTRRKHSSLGRNLDAPKFDDNDHNDDVVDYNGGSSKNFLYEDDEELAKIRAKYSKKKVEDNDD